MKAAYIKQTGPPENIIVGEFPTPEPTGSQVLVRVKAAALNPVDTYIRAGTIPMNIPLPLSARNIPYFLSAVRITCTSGGYVEMSTLALSRTRAPIGM